MRSQGRVVQLAKTCRRQHCWLFPCIHSYLLVSLCFLVPCYNIESNTDRNPHLVLMQLLSGLLHEIKHWLIDSGHSKEPDAASLFLNKKED